MSKDNDKRKPSEQLLDSDCLEAFDHVYAYINNEIEDPESALQISCITSFPLAAAMGVPNPFTH